MTLKEWLFRSKISVTRMAFLLDTSRAHLSGIVNGTRWAHKKLAEKIERATEGKVKASSSMRKKRKTPLNRS